MLEWRRLEVLLAVTRAGSMAGAAESLNYTPSAVSQQIAALERETGTKLLDRLPRGVRPTETGRVLVAHAEAVRRRLVQAEADVADLVGLRAGRLRIGAFASAGGQLVPAAIEEFRRRHPSVYLSLEIVEPHHCAEAVRAGDLDLGLVFDFTKELVLDLGGLRSIRLHDDPQLLAVGRQHRLAEARTVALIDLAEEPWIRDNSSDPLCRVIVERACAAAGFTPRSTFESDNWVAIGRLVATGVGIAMVSSLALDQLGDGCRLIKVRPEIRRRINVITRPDPAPAAVAMMAAFARLDRTIHAP